MKTTASDNPSQPAEHFTVTEQDLPLCCPMPGMELWNMHPRVYLDIEATQHVQCPYCGTRYSLVSEK